MINLIEKLKNDVIHRWIIKRGILVFNIEKIPSGSIQTRPVCIYKNVTQFLDG